ncbi:IS630 transposase-related protein [Symbiopectobacterium sp. RP]
MIKDVEPYPDAYQKERAERFGVCQKAIWQALKKLGLTYIAKRHYFDNN